MFANISLVLYLNVSVLTFGGYNLSLVISPCLRPLSLRCGKNGLEGSCDLLCYKI